MKMIPKLRKHNYLTRISVFLIAIALIAGTVSCEDDGAQRYTLTMATNPLAGGTVIDLIGGSPYLAGTIVNITATAMPGYLFTNWSAPAGSFGNPAAATTTFTMPDQNVTVTANFALIPSLLLDHFKGYVVNYNVTGPVMHNVYLEDQFGAYTNATIRSALAFYNPAEKWHQGNVTPILNSTHHFTVYAMNCTKVHLLRQVLVDNQFGRQNLTLSGPWALAVPTQKEGHAKPDDLDHYLIYEVILAPYQGVYINLTDQWGGEEVYVEEAAFFATPAKKTYKGNVTDILNPDVHGVIYSISGLSVGNLTSVDNQLGNQTLNVTYTAWMVVPSEKVVPPTPELDHFKCYNVTGALPVMGDVSVFDQFGHWDGRDATEAIWFCNPVDKNGKGITEPDNHLTVYNITITWGLPACWWNVTVNNQFGFQNMTVYGPVALAAPTWKVYPNQHGPPKYLDHYLLYEVLSGSPVNISVDLDDEFPNVAMVNVTYPRYFANPVLYKYHDGNETGAWDPETHLVFYDISDNPEFFGVVVYENQFDYTGHNLTPFGQLLAVPSDKLDYEQIICPP